MKTWYKIAVVGRDPFSNGLSDKTQTQPYGNLGGDSRYGLFEGSDGSAGHPNDYFSESNKGDSAEKRMEEIRKKQRIEKLKKIEKKKNLENKELNKKAQWGSGGPKLPVWENENWVLDTYREIKNLEIPDQQEEPSKKQSENNQYQNALSKSVSIRSSDGNETEIGSGFFINSNMILTCFHVISPSGKTDSLKISVKYQEKQYNARLMVYDSVLDIAIISLDDPSVKGEFFELGSSENINQGDPIILVGTPLGFENIVGEGILSAKETEYQEEGQSSTYMFISANLAPGNSGGPVISKNDNLAIGVAAAIVTDQSSSSGLNAAIPIDRVKDFLNANSIKFTEGKNGQ